MNRPAQKLNATALGGVIGFAIFLGIGLPMQNNATDPGVLIVCALILVIACFLGK